MAVYIKSKHYSLQLVYESLSTTSKIKLFLITKEHTTVSLGGSIDSEIHMLVVGYSNFH